jgi:N-acetylmuramoyl-L-alanine amidase
MSVTTNATLGPADGTMPQPTPGPEDAFVPGPDALQSLLFLSALNAQARQRRTTGRVEETEANQFVLDEVLQLVAERARSMTGADGVAIALAEGDAIICRASAGQIAPDPGASLDPDSGFSGACIRRGKVVRCDDTESDTRVNVEISRKLGARSLVAVPLGGQKAVLGLLEAFSYDAHAFNDSDVQTLLLLAELILAAIKPEDEDRLAQISQRVVGGAVEPLSEKKQTAPPAPETLAIESPQEFSPKPVAAKPSHPGHPGLRVVFAVVLFAAALGAGLWWKILHSTQNVIATSRAALKPVNDPQSPTPVNAISATDSGDADLATSPPTISDAEIKQKLALLPQVTGIRHWSSSEGSTVVVDLQDQVQYEAHRLTDPVRIYVDLHDTALSPGLFGKVIEIGDSLLMRVRLAQPMPGVTRVVLETSGGTNFSVSLEPNPYRLVVQVRPVGPANQSNAKRDLFAPVTPAEGNRLASSGETREDMQLRAHVPRFRIALDAGHGGWDLGTVGRQGLLEKDLVLDIVDRLGNLIQKRLGAEVVYTRQDDDYISLEKRTEIANQSQADIFLSVHANYSVSASARGVETYYTNTFSSIHARTPGASLQDVSFANVDIREKVQESHKFAATVQRAMHTALAAGNSGIPDRGVKAASYVVLTGTSMPAILAEVSFVSSPTDEENLQSAAYRERIAEALYKGVARYEAAPRKVKIASATDKRAVQ